MSIATPSSQAETVTNLFAAVANPARVDMTRPRATAAASPQHNNAGDARSQATQQSLFDRLVEQDREEEEPPPLFGDIDDDPFDVGGGGEEDPRFALGDLEEEEPDLRWEEPAAPPPMTEQEQRQNEILEKQSVLMELQRLQQHHGVKLSREYTMQDNLADMQFEIRRHLASVDEATSVKFMADGLKLMCTGLELANNKFGPFLELDGWSATVTSPENMPRYDSALSRLYRKYWGRKSTMSPEMELGFALVSSILMHHFSKKAQGMLFGGAAAAPPPRRPPPPAAAPPPPPPPREPPASSTLFSSSEGMPPPSPDEGQEEEPPPPSGGIPASVPVSARKRLVF